MGTKRTIDSGRKDRKGRPIKVSENRLAAGDNVDSKRSQLDTQQDDSHQKYVKVRDMIDKCDEYDMSYGFEYAGRPIGEEEFVDRYAQGDSGLRAGISLGNTDIDRLANAKAMFSDWSDTESQYYLSGHGVVKDDFIIGDGEISMDAEDFVNLHGSDHWDDISSMSWDEVYGADRQGACEDIVNFQMPESIWQSEYFTPVVSDMESIEFKDFDQEVVDHIVNGTILSSNYDSPREYRIAKNNEEQRVNDEFDSKFQQKYSQLKAESSQIHKQFVKDAVDKIMWGDFDDPDKKNLVDDFGNIKIDGWAVRDYVEEYSDNKYGSVYSQVTSVPPKY